MGKLRVLSAKAVCQILSEHGFTQVRQRGSHIIMQKKIDDSTITVPVPNYSEVKIGTLQSIIRQSGLPRALFE
ncbi:type II toxin-antitoxin system HicA family toxin [Pseudanabaena galeata UHCC 0370]|uniref:Type II toxin-antitoxin system HicA family toxin n=1 Tax=Pseudanabaena galeata UHCC 0370 TaxID=3110310 RepID=A0ABU5TJY9_9CYAN|nr:type II toxin-antitoxin system HicA family toxin [Pseudanabaena galeata]MEA5478642.1 type II toxin-antitoxin system HicA family toxin [Pseudanabaena galeata UHCC 0370]